MKVTTVIDEKSSIHGAGGGINDGLPVGDRLLGVSNGFTGV